VNFLNHHCSGGSLLVKTFRKSPHAAASKIQAVVRRGLARNMETKQSNHTSTDGAEIGHNNFIVLDSNVSETSQGVGTDGAEIGHHD
jgi:hypothetical protein